MRRRTFLAAATATVLGCRSSSPTPSRVVLYCAQDQEFAEALLADFTARTVLPVVPKYDTEAGKSVALAEELLREANRPRCDVHWNNEILNAIRLRRAGVYDSYDSPSSAPYPAFTKTADHTFQSFAARARILIVNTQVPTAERPKLFHDLTKPRWKGRAAMAKPLHGTTATHAACLYAVLGADAAERLYKDLAANDVQIVPGNKHVAQDVAAGRALVGVTDTDDAIVEVEAGKPVAIIAPDADGIGTLFIPNTLAVVKGGPNPDGARKLVDYLLSAETEKRLAEAESRQIPMNPEVKADLPASIPTPKTVKPMAVDFEKAADQWERSQSFLRDLFAR